MQNPKVGKYTPEGTVYPSQSLSGKPYARSEYDPPPAILHDLGGGAFAVGDVFPPPGFDAEAELNRLKALVAPAPTSSRRVSEAGEKAE
jgi:hypothetical protein